MIVPPSCLMALFFFMAWVMLSGQSPVLNGGSSRNKHQLRPSCISAPAQQVALHAPLYASKRYWRSVTSNKEGCGAIHPDLWVRRQLHGASMCSNSALTLSLGVADEAFFTSAALPVFSAIRSEKFFFWKVTRFATFLFSRSLSHC